MRNTFFNKVKFERKVLDTVNQSNFNSIQLTGLSKAAIELWQRKSTLDKSDKIAHHLLILGKLCQTLSDRSHESFHPIRVDIEADIELGLKKLDSLLRC